MVWCFGASLFLYVGLGAEGYEDIDMLSLTGFKIMFIDTVIERCSRLYHSKNAYSWSG